MRVPWNKGKKLTGKVLKHFHKEHKKRHAHIICAKKTRYDSLYVPMEEEEMPKKGYKRTEEHELHRFQSRESWKRDEDTRKKIALTLKGHVVSPATKQLISYKNQLRTYQALKLQEHYFNEHQDRAGVDKTKSYGGCVYCEWLVPGKVNKKDLAKLNQKFKVEKVLVNAEILKAEDDAITKAVMESS